MKLELTDAQAVVLRDLLEESLREMSHEIAATDNAAFRARLAERRSALEHMVVALGHAMDGHSEVRGWSELERELARPGD